jgi:hypothetical protein
MAFETPQKNMDKKRAAPAMKNRKNAKPFNPEYTFII